MARRYYLAIDIGASSGRHVLGSVVDGKIELEEVHRFDNVQVRRRGHDCWDIDMIWENIRKVTGTRAARRVRQDALGTVGTKAERSRTRGLGQAAAAYGLAGAGLGGAAYGAKKLYDRFGRGREEDIAAALGE